MRDGRIEVDGLTKHFGAVHAVRDVSFAVEPGTVTGLLGPNGAGKTTTLRMLLGLVRPTAGTATIGGHTFDRPTLTTRGDRRPARARTIARAAGPGLVAGPAETVGRCHGGWPGGGSDAPGANRTRSRIPLRGAHASPVPAVHAEGRDPSGGDDDDTPRLHHRRRAALSNRARTLRPPAR